MTHTERRQQWKTRIEAYKASGLSARDFCRQHSITCFLQEKIPHFCKDFSPGTGGEFFC